MLETIREYAHEALAAGGRLASVHKRHASHYLNFAALRWCASDDASAEVGLALVSTLGRGWTAIGGEFAETRRCLETFLARSPARTASRATALCVLDNTLRLQHEFEAAGQAAEEALTIYRELGDGQGIAEATAGLGLVAANRGDYAQGLRLLEESLASARERDDRVQTANRLRDVGITCIACGEFARARAALIESARLAADDTPYKLRAQTHLANLDRLEGDFPLARERLAAASRLQKEVLIDDLPSTMLVRLAEANLDRAAGQFDTARAGIVDVLRHLRQRAEFIGLADTVAMLGTCEIAAGAHERGVVLLAVASNVEGPIGTIHMPDVRIEAPPHLELARAALGDTAYASAWAEGRAKTLAQAVGEVLDSAE